MIMIVIVIIITSFNIDVASTATAVLVNALCVTYNKQRCQAQHSSSCQYARFATCKCVIQSIIAYRFHVLYTPKEQTHHITYAVVCHTSQEKARTVMKCHS
uniref:Myomesin-3 n=1 Tax=Lygus hesperus TaxID=30085 RepID=A0A0A9YX34_LYGHE